jgi:chemotaxis signal transduction protein
VKDETGCYPSSFILHLLKFSLFWIVSNESYQLFLFILHTLYFGVNIMAVFSPLTSRRSTRRVAEVTQQLIVFRLRNEGFALPIRAVQKVIPMGNVYGAPGGTGVSLTLYQDRELLVIDPEHRIFRGTQVPALEPSAPPAESACIKSETTGQRYLLIVQSSQGKVVGLPIEEPPSLHRVPSRAFAPLTSDYIAYGNIRCVSVLVKQNDDRPPLFLLNPDQLVQPQQALPSSVS